MVSIPACHAGDQGSIPCRGALLGIHNTWLLWSTDHTCDIPIMYPVSFLSLLAKVLPDRESNPGLPRDRRGYSPLYYRGLNVKANRVVLIDRLKQVKIVTFWPFSLTKEPNMYIYLENQVRATSDTKEFNMWFKSGCLPTALGFLHHAQIFRLLLKISVEETN